MIRGRLLQVASVWRLITTRCARRGWHLAPTLQHLSIFAFTYSGHYKRSQSELEDAVELGDPRALQGLLAEHPYQVEGLLRLSEYLMLAGQLELSSEHNERCLYACEQYCINVPAA